MRRTHVNVWTCAIFNSLSLTFRTLRSSPPSLSSPFRVYRLSIEHLCKSIDRVPLWRVQHWEEAVFLCALCVCSWSDRFLLVALINVEGECADLFNYYNHKENCQCACSVLSLPCFFFFCLVLFCICVDVQRSQHLHRRRFDAADVWTIKNKDDVILVQCMVISARHLFLPLSFSLTHRSYIAIQFSMWSRWTEAQFTGWTAFLLPIITN